MAGIYIHIPFCKTKCTYCDFFSKTDFKLQSGFIFSLQKELQIRKNYLQNAPVATIYFGGGTPSTLPVSDIGAILTTVFEHFKVESDAEITLEANPDDLNPDFLNKLHSTRINRLSIGIQNFSNEELTSINRRHTAEAAWKAVKDAQQSGFENISIDLIYGLPHQTLNSWKEQVERAFSLDIQHISAYGLTYEKGTPLWNQLQKGAIKPADDETMIEMYQYLVEMCGKNGFQQYEISNFARTGYRSRHNSAYWKQESYLGIGPSAHSYNGDSRRWNVSSIPAYCKGVNDEKKYFEVEHLTEQEKYNDFVMVSLRTIEGIDLDKLKKLFGNKMLEYTLKMADKHLKTGVLQREEQFIRHTPAGILVSDRIIADMMKV